MKFNKNIVSLVLLALASVDAKNVFRPIIPDRQLAAIEEEIQLQKRQAEANAQADPKNVFHYDVLDRKAKRDATAEPDAKNIAHLNLVYDNKKLKKRDAKNIAHLNLVYDDKAKRDAKNVVHFNNIADDKVKRDAEPKNIVHLNLVLDEDEMAKKKVKRDGKNVYHLSFSESKRSNLEKREGKNLIHMDLVLDESKLKAKRDAKDLYDVNLVIDDSHDLVKRAVEQGVISIDLDVDEEADDSMFIPEIGNTDNLKYTLMPEVKSGNLADALTQNRQLSIFSGYMRDIIDLYKKCESTDDYSINAIPEQNNQMLLIFAPTDDAIFELTSKPWSFPRPIIAEYEDEITEGNIRHFVESHIVETGSVDFSSERAVRLMSINGNVIKLKNFDDGFKLSLPDVHDWLPIEKIDILDNGALLTIGKTLTWPGRDA